MGRTAFTHAELESIKELLREVRYADRSRQKTLRNKLRSQYDFYISDFATDQQGFTASDVDDLVRRGVITITADPDDHRTITPRADRLALEPIAAPLADSNALKLADDLPASFTREALEAIGFVGWQIWDRLWATDLAGVPAKPAVYVVYRESADEPTFLETSPAGHFKGQDPTVAVEVLEAKWVPTAHTVYIGKADVARRRLREFARFGAGHPVGHRGGRYIWQLVDSDELLVAWRTINGESTAREYEKRLLARFAERHDGRRPFANLTG